MRLLRYIGPLLYPTLHRIPDDDIEGYLRDKMGLSYCGSYDENGTKSMMFSRLDGSSSSSKMTMIVVKHGEKGSFAHLTKFGLRPTARERTKIAAMGPSKEKREQWNADLDSIADSGNRHLTLFTIWGGRIAARETVRASEIDSDLLRQVRKRHPHAPEGTRIETADRQFSVRLLSVLDSGDGDTIAFELNCGDVSAHFLLYPSGCNVHHQSIGLSGGLFGSSINEGFKASLATMEPDDLAVYSPAPTLDEIHTALIEILTNRPALMMVSRRSSTRTKLGEQLVRVATHFALAVLE